MTIYPLALPSGDPKRLPMPTPNIIGIYAAARARLQSLADRTGGRLNEINQLQYMAQLYREVAANLANALHRRLSSRRAIARAASGTR